MNSLIPFTFEHRDVRVAMLDGLEWWVGKDVCDALEIANNRDAISRLEDYEKLTSVIPTSGQNRQVWLVNESGIYSLTLTSRTDKAKAFKKWLTTEVLPQIRKSGNYNAGELQALRESLMLAKSERDTYQRLWLATRKTVLRFEQRSFLTWKDKREILTLLINNYPLSKIQRITKKSADRIKRFRDELTGMNNEELDRVLTTVKSVGRERSAESPLVDAAGETEAAL